MMKTQRLLSAAIMAAVFVVPGVKAQVEVVESNNRLIGNPVVPPAVTASPLEGGSATPANGTAEMFYQMQILQQELSELRGLVEEQAYEIKRLKQQRLDDYLSLDKRLSSISGAAATAGPVDTGDVSVPANVAPAAISGAEPAAAITADESQQYRAAIDLILKQKDFVKADAALNQYLQDFPKGRYAANSQYWLGELALLKGDLEKSREWFSRMIAEWPDHNKVADANYKLGTVYHKLGDSEKAKSMLESVASGSGNVALLAKKYLSNNF